MLLRLVAHIYCDRCGAIGVLELEDDRALGLRRGLSVAAVIEDALQTHQFVDGGFGSMRLGEMLCAACTAPAAAPAIDEELEDA